MKKTLLLLVCAIGCAHAQKSNRAIMLGDVDAPLTPTDSPGGGTYSSTQSVTFSDPTATAIFYTNDGSTTPTCLGTGTLYTGAISTSVTTTYKVIGCNGLAGSGILTSTYTIGTVPTLISTGHGCAASADAGATATITLNTTGATFIVLNLLDYSASTSTISDSNGNTWIPLTAQTLSGVQQRGRLYYAMNPTVGSGQVFTATYVTSFSFPSICVAAFSGIATSAPFDTESGAISASAVTSLQPGSLTTSQSNELLITGFGDNGTDTASSWAVNSSFTVTDKVGDSSGNSSANGMAYLVKSTTGAVNPTWSFTSHANVLAVMADFTVSPGGILSWLTITNGQWASLSNAQWAAMTN